jgi:acetylornithine deacetylase/succinyl-diaminopimelate desuccinylase-like protein
MRGRGSPSFAAALSSLVKGAAGSGLRTDSIMVSDTIWPSAAKPAIPYGLRGLLAFVVRLRTGEKAVHSGTTGGAARNPVTELAALVTDCQDVRTGRVKIPGFYDGVRKLTAAERRGLGASAASLTSFRNAHGLRSLRVSTRRRLAEVIMAEPTFEVHGIVGGYAGPGVKTIVPHEAEAKISCRLVPGQRPRQVLACVKRFIAQRCPDARVELEAALEPYLGDLDGPFLQAAARAAREAFGKKPAMTREGGSIGAVVTMARLLRKEVVLLGLSLPEDGYHALDESFAWSQAARGIELFYRYFRHLAALGGNPRAR